MRRAICALTVAFALGVCGMVSADEGNWFTRLFTRSADKKDVPKKSSTAKDGAVTLTPNLPNVALIRAQANWQRRQAVCEKLNEIGVATSDEDLKRRAADLDERAYKLFDMTSRQRREAQKPIGEINLKDTKSGLRWTKGGQ